ncbi:MAG: DUF2852 domain-containing protein [Hyphomicrobiales bacterium]|nr:DUF2852 domain-containing protein [Hyphomicrobiales bacterium]
MVIAQRLDDYGKPAWLAVMVVGFIVFWPIGLAILGYMIWSGRMGCGRGNWSRWKSEKWARGGWRRGHRAGGFSGNSAFDEYKAETLRRLEDEQQEFMDFLKRLRDAKDKAEFDQFMNERRNRPQTPPSDMSQEGSPA